MQKFASLRAPLNISVIDLIKKFSKELLKELSKGLSKEHSKEQNFCTRITPQQERAHLTSASSVRDDRGSDRDDARKRDFLTSRPRLHLVK